MKEKENVKQVTIAPINVSSAVVKINGKTNLLIDKMPQEVKNNTFPK